MGRAHAAQQEVYSAGPYLWYCFVEVENDAAGTLHSIEDMMSLRIISFISDVKVLPPIAAEVIRVCCAASLTPCMYDGDHDVQHDRTNKVDRPVIHLFSQY